MKRVASLLAGLAGASILAGCVVAPLEPGPVVVHGSVHPAPVVVQPAPVYVRPGYPHRGLRDRDGDGVPNRYDRRPNNPYRY